MSGIPNGPRGAPGGEHHDDRLTELLPWYVNGTLAANDQAWVDSYLAEHPEARGELAWYRSLQAQIRADEPQVSDEIGLDRAMARIQADNVEIARAGQVREASDATAAAQLQRQLRGGPTDAGMRGHLRRWLASWSLRPAMAVALAVIAVQSVVLVHLAGSDEDTEIRSLRPHAQADQGPLLKIDFKSDATEADIRLLLVQIEGSMAGGPGQLGDWYVRVPTRRIEAAVAQLKSSRIVESTAVVDAMPARD